MKISIVAILTLFLIVCEVDSLCAQRASLENAIFKTIRHETSLDTTIVPGLLIGVWDGDSTYYIKYGRKIREEDYFELGSVSKPVSYWLYSTFLNHSALLKQKMICEYFPDSLCTDAWSKISIYDLLHHEAGLDLMPRFSSHELRDFELDQYSQYYLEDLIKGIQDQEPVKGERAYSHLGYALLYWVFQKSGGLQTILQNVKDKYGITFTCADSLLADGHGFAGLPVMPWHPEILMSSLGFRARISDMMNWLQVQVSENIYNIQHIESQMKNRKIRDRFTFSHGWFVVPWRKSFYLFHHGRTEGHQATIAWMPNKRKAVIILGNGIAFHEDLAGMIINIIDN